MVLERHASRLIRGWGALAGVEKDPGSLGFARDDTRTDPSDTNTGMVLEPHASRLIRGWVGWLALRKIRGPLRLRSGQALSGACPERSRTGSG